MENAQWGRIFLIIGIVCLAIGIGFYFLPRIPYFNRLGRLPGDLVWKKDNVTVYFPLVTSLVVSIVLSLIFFIVQWLRR